LLEFHPHRLDAHRSEGTISSGSTRTARLPGPRRRPVLDVEPNAAPRIITARGHVRFSRRIRLT
jgi:hypothetical protein